MLEKSVMFLLGVLTTGAGWLIARMLRKEHVTEELARRKTAADLIAHLRMIGVPMEQVDALLATLGRRRGDKVGEPIKKELTVEQFIEAKELAAIEAAQSQREMNVLQAKRASRLDQRMNDALEELRGYIGGDELKKFDEAHSAWLAFRDKECEFAGVTLEGGSLQPFVMSGVFSNVTKERAETLENQLAMLEGRQPE